MRANDLPLSNDLEAWPDSSVGIAPTYKVRGREFESRSGRLFSRTFTVHLTDCSLLLSCKGEANLSEISRDAKLHKTHFQSLG